MFPFMPLLLGFITGAAAVKLAQKNHGQRYVKQAGDKIRSVTVSGLESLESSSHRLRQKLQSDEQSKGDAVQTESAVPEVKNDGTEI